ncbi:MAG: ATP-grasp domain-containing protein [Candidatus Altiarchaeales archaeon]|nr:ATP-grasp domain-containing protein [Candidatus Altiarchaeales archaeon]
MKVALLFRKATTDEFKVDDLIGRSGLEMVRAVSNSLKELGHVVEVINPEDLKKLLNNHFDIAFNLCDDGFFGKSYLEPHVPALLDILGIPHTGSDYFSLALCLDKYKTKQILSYHKIPTPQSQIFETGSEKLDKNLKFPLIVKPSREDASIGIHNDSVIRKKNKLKSKIFELLSKHKQPILVEEYIDGRELNVGILGNEKPLVLPLSEIMFNLPADMNKICSYEAKWVVEHESYDGTKPNCPAKVSKKLDKRLVELALKSYKLMGCRDYGRVDFRVDCFGRPFVLEVNPNPDISQSAGLANMASKAGISYTQLIGKIINSAVERMKSGEKR